MTQKSDEDAWHKETYEAFKLIEELPLPPEDRADAAEIYWNVRRYTHPHLRPDNSFNK